jgi:AcrR family transcriptional regulator
MRPALREMSAPPSTDRRCVRTRQALRDALAAEIEATGDLTQVTVTAVSDRAGVTRRTFYSHFRDIPDLVGQIEDETVRDSRELVGRIAATHLDDLEQSISRFEPCPGAVELLTYFRDRGTYLSALLGDGGDPAFAEKLTCMVRDAVRDRASEGLVALAQGAFFDYYLTFAISAEVGVLVRWLTSGMREGVDVMARIMTALMFVRPGDLYGKKIDFDIPALGVAVLGMKGRTDD